MTLLVAAVSCGGGGAAQGPTAAKSSSPTIAPPVVASPTCPPARVSLQLSAKGLRFDADCLAVPAGTAFKVEFRNGDAGVPHNLGIHDQNITRTFFKGDVVTGVEDVTYRVPALKAGTYLFHCDIHPNVMNGTLVVGG
jgi:plastocyanin